MNFEANTGYSVIHPDIRTSALYMYIMQRKPLAWQERMIIIIEEENPLPKNWKPEFPDFDSHLDEIGIIEDGDTDEFQPFWFEKSTKSDTCIGFLHTKIQHVFTRVNCTCSEH